MSYTDKFLEALSPDARPTPAEDLDVPKIDAPRNFDDLTHRVPTDTERAVGEGVLIAYSGLHDLHREDAVKRAVEGVINPNDLTIPVNSTEGVRLPDRPSDQDIHNALNP